VSAFYKEELTHGYNQAGYAVPYQYREYNYSSSLTNPEYVKIDVLITSIFPKSKEYSIPHLSVLIPLSGRWKTPNVFKVR